MTTHAPVKKSAPAAMKTGYELLSDPALNKGTAFTEAERAALGLRGLLPPGVSTIERQVDRMISNLRGQSSDLNRYVDLMELLSRNETLFFRVIQDHIEEMMPIIYTPVVGRACQTFAQIFRKPRGIFLSRRDKGHIREALRNWPIKDVRVIVVTDGERILGLGDLGANGMGIPIGKLLLYTSCGGVPPGQTLPIMLDVGTNDPKLLADPLYLGVREKRLTGAAYDELVKEFIDAVQEVFPKALTQFEDFANHNAFRILQEYRDKVLCFNDDIQGTASVTVAALLASSKLAGRKLSEETVLFCGAGEAAVGIADLTVSAMRAAGLSEKEARGRCWLVDSKGLVESSRADLQEHKKPYAHKHAPAKDLLAAVKSLKPTSLIGVSGKAGQFTKEIVEEMARLNKAPAVFALSNPTSNAECTAEQAYQWTDGRAIFASGSPFDPVVYKGRKFVPGQANNAYVFPGVGLGIVACGAKRVTDEMFLAAAKALADLTSKEDLAMGRLFPPLTVIRQISVKIAEAVVRVAYERNLAPGTPPKDLAQKLAALQYQPVYKNLV